MWLRTLVIYVLLRFFLRTIIFTFPSYTSALSFFPALITTRCLYQSTSEHFTQHSVGAAISHRAEFNCFSFLPQSAVTSGHCKCNAWLWRDACAAAMWQKQKQWLVSEEEERWARKRWQVIILKPQILSMTAKSSKKKKKILSLLALKNTASQFLEEMTDHISVC